MTAPLDEAKRAEILRLARTVRVCAARWGYERARTQNAEDDLLRAVEKLALPYEWAAACHPDTHYHSNPHRGCILR